MLRRTARAGTLLAVVVLATSACELSVRVGARLDADGGGELSLALDLDRELVDGLRQADTARRSGSTDLASLQALFDELASLGWTAARSEPQGGLSLKASKPFPDDDGFRATLAELRGAGDGRLSLQALGLDLRYEVEPSFVRTRARLEGTIELGAGADLDPQIGSLQDVLGDLVHFEIRAEMPGEVSVEDGDGSVSGSTVIWRPRLGDTMRFSARSSALELGTLLAVLFPFLGVLAFGGWVIAGRRRGLGARPEPTADENLADPPTQPVVPLPRAPEPSLLPVGFAELDRVVSINEAALLDRPATEDGFAAIDLTEQPSYPDPIA